MPSAQICRFALSGLLTCYGNRLESCAGVAMPHAVAMQPRDG